MFLEELGEHPCRNDTVMVNDYGWLGTRKNETVSLPSSRVGSFGRLMVDPLLMLTQTIVIGNYNCRPSKLAISQSYTGRANLYFVLPRRRRACFVEPNPVTLAD